MGVCLTENETSRRPPQICRRVSAAAHDIPANGAAATVKRKTPRVRGVKRYVPARDSFE